MVAQLSQLLSIEGFSVATAESGERGLDLLKTLPAKLVISDQMMPAGMSGTRFLSEVRKRYPDVVTMILSAYAEPEYILDAMNEAKTFYYLTKPWDDDDLIQRVHDALRFFHAGWTQRDQLERANSLLAQAEKMAILGSYAGGVAHNIRNMIFPLVAELDSIRMDLEDAMEDKNAADPIQSLKAHSQEIFKRVESGEERIMEVSELIESMMSLYRGNPKESEIFDLASVIKNAIRLEKTRKESKQIAFCVDKIGDDFTVEGLKGPLSSTVVEFLKNASYAIGKARPSGEGEIRVRLEAAKDEALGEFLRLSVKDNGCGMSDAVRKEIFTPLFTTKAGVGTGLGLSVAYQMIGQHHGRIEVESKEGKGAIFTVILPKRQKEKIAAPSG